MNSKAPINSKKKGKGRRCITVIRFLLIAFLIILIFQSISHENINIIVSNLDSRFQFWWKRLEISYSSVANDPPENRNSTSGYLKVPIVVNSHLNLVTHSSIKDNRSKVSPVVGNQFSKLNSSSYPITSPARLPRVRKPRVGRKSPLPQKATHKPKPRPVKRTRKPRRPDDWMYDGVLNLDAEWYSF
jgi:hypothetical protein